MELTRTLNEQDNCQHDRFLVLLCGIMLPCDNASLELSSIHQFFVEYLFKPLVYAVRGSLIKQDHWPLNPFTPGNINLSISE